MALSAADAASVDARCAGVAQPPVATGGAPDGACGCTHGKATVAEPRHLRQRDPAGHAQAIAHHMATLPVSVAYHEFPSAHEIRPSETGGTVAWLESFRPRRWRSQPWGESGGAVYIALPAPSSSGFQSSKPHCGAGNAWRLSHSDKGCSVLTRGPDVWITKPRVPPAPERASSTPGHGRVGARLAVAAGGTYAPLNMPTWRRPCGCSARQRRQRPRRPCPRQTGPESCGCLAPAGILACTGRV